MACKVLRIVSKDEAERARLMSEYKFVTDTQSQMVQAKRVGLAEGRKEGQEEKRKEFLALLKSGKSVEDVIQLYENTQKSTHRFRRLQ